MALRIEPSRIFVKLANQIERLALIEIEAAHGPFRACERIKQRCLRPAESGRGRSTQLRQLCSRWHRKLAGESIPEALIGNPYGRGRSVRGLIEIPQSVDELQRRKAGLSCRCS